MLEALKLDVFKANQRLVSSGLVVLTWGNASGFDPETKLMVIKPSGVDYDKMTADDMVVVDLDGNVVEGKLRPSSDTATHLEFYRNFKGVKGAVHTHSVEATAWAQSCREIPCYGTTHADYIYGNIPCCRDLTREEVESAYELETGRVIASHFEQNGLNPNYVPCVLARHHGPFAWGKDAINAVHNAVVMEECAMMAWHTEALPEAQTRGNLPEYVKEKHFMRKHGPNAYYGQKK